MAVPWLCQRPAGGFGTWVLEGARSRGSRPGQGGWSGVPKGPLSWLQWQMNSRPALPFPPPHTLPPPNKKEEKEQLYSARCTFHSMSVGDSSGPGLRAAASELFAGQSCPGFRCAVSSFAPE